MPPAGGATPQGGGPNAPRPLPPIPGPAPARQASGSILGNFLDRIRIGLSGGSSGGGGSGPGDGDGQGQGAAPGQQAPAGDNNRGPGFRFNPAAAVFTPGG